MKMRWIVAWAFYLIGDAIWRVFELWLGFGLRGPLCRAYNWCMTMSDAIQGDGSGPWYSVERPSPK
jgi:hypothetical protein